MQEALTMPPDEQRKRNAPISVCWHATRRRSGRASSLDAVADA